MTRRALAYVSDVILGTTGDVISREVQRQAIRRHASENGIEIVAWFEDEAWSAEVLSRDGIRKLLAAEACDCLLVERVWSLSRNWSLLEGFMKELRGKGMRLESATLLWDCTSQRARHFYAEKKPKKPVAIEHMTVMRPVRIKKPEHLFFANLVHKHSRA